MSVSDPVADMICIIKNGGKVNKETVMIPSSKMKYAISKILKKEGFIKNSEIVKIDNHNTIKMTLKYNSRGNSVITDMKKVTTPGKRTYVNKKDIAKVKNGFGISILSTNKGVLSGKDARIQNVGGEVLCNVW